MHSRLIVIYKWTEQNNYPILEIMSAPDLEFSSGKQQHIIQVRIYFRMEMEKVGQPARQEHTPGGDSNTSLRYAIIYFRMEMDIKNKITHKMESS